MEFIIRLLLGILMVLNGQVTHAGSDVKVVYLAAQNDNLVLSDQILAKVSGVIIASQDSCELYLKRRELPGRSFNTIDSMVLVDENQFQFDLQISQPGYYHIFYKDKKSSASAPILIDNHGKLLEVNIKIDTSHFGTGTSKVDIRKITVSGSPDNELLERFFSTYRYFYTDLVNPIEKKIINKVSTGQNDDELDSLNQLLTDYKKDQRTILDSILVQEMGVSISVYQALKTWVPESDEALDEIVSRFTEEKPRSFITPLIVLLAQNIKERALISNPSPELSLMDSNGEVFDLKSESLSEVILLDFWASWCKPCIEEIPAWKKIYNDYPKDKLTIVGISLDSDESKWREALTRYAIPWVSLKDDDTVSKKYNVVTLPTNYLLNSEGVIIESNITPQDLIKILNDQ